MADTEHGMAQSGGEWQPVPQQPAIQENATPHPAAQSPVAHLPLSQQHAEREEQPAAERLVKTFNSWQKVVLALTALLVAAGGLAAAGVKVLQTVTSSTGDAAATTRTGQTPDQPSAHQPASGSGISGGGKPVSPTPSAVAPVFLGTNSFGIPDGGSLTYSTASGSQNALAYFGELSEVTAENNVNLVVLDPPAPTASTAYAACEADTDYTSEIDLSDLAPGSTFCALTPDNQVLWITLRPSDPNSQSNALNVTVSQWQGPVQPQSGN